MTKSVKRLTADLKDKRFKTDEGTVFTIREGEYFTDGEISRQHRRYLTQLKTGLLVSVSFYGQPVPLVVVEDGVVRLVSIETGDEILDTSSAISEMLGVKETRQPVGLFAA